MANCCENKLSVTGDVKSALEYIAKDTGDAELPKVVDFEKAVPMPKALGNLFDYSNLKEFKIARLYDGRLGLIKLSNLRGRLIADRNLIDSGASAIMLMNKAEENKAYDDDKTLEVFIEDCVRACDSVQDIPDYIDDLMKILSKHKALYCEKHYGCADWYSWRCANWGTKWNAESASTNYFEDLVDDEYVCFEFETAWQPPKAWLESTVKLLKEKGVDAHLSLTYVEHNMRFGGELNADEHGNVESIEYSEDRLIAEFGLEDLDDIDNEDEAA